MTFLESISVPWQHEKKKVKEEYYIHSSSSWMHTRRYPPQSTLPNSMCVWKRRFSVDTKESENRHKRLEYIQREWREKEKETIERTKQETSRNSLPASILFHSHCHYELQGDPNPWKSYRNQKSKSSWAKKLSNSAHPHSHAAHMCKARGRRRIRRKEENAPARRRENILTYRKEGRKKCSYMYPETEEGRKDIYQTKILRRFPRTSPQTWSPGHKKLQIPKKKTGDKEEQAEQEPRNRQESFWSW